MSQRAIPFGLDEFYHLYNRGVDKRQIFLDASDYDRFTLLLYLVNGTEPVRMSDQDNWKEKEMYTHNRDEPLISIGAYCLMPNHFHILAHETTEGGITRFMQRLSTAYTMYFNRKNERTGSLFGGKFKAQHADSDVYLKYLYSYIHLNPTSIIQPEWKEEGVRDIKKVEEFLEQYDYSSFLDYKNIERPESAILNRDNFPEYFDKQDVSGFIFEINEWLMLKQAEQTERVEQAK